MNELLLNDIQSRKNFSREHKIKPVAFLKSNVIGSSDDIFIFQR